MKLANTIALFFAASVSTGTASAADRNLGEEVLQYLMTVKQTLQKTVGTAVTGIDVEPMMNMINESDDGRCVAEYFMKNMSQDEIRSAVDNMKTFAESNTWDAGMEEVVMPMVSKAMESCGADPMPISVGLAAFQSEAPIIQAEYAAMIKRGELAAIVNDVGNIEDVEFVGSRYGSSKSSKANGGRDIMKLSKMTTRASKQTTDEKNGKGKGPGCFPQDALVEVKGKGIIEMQYLALGDYVRSATGYSKVYAYGALKNDAKDTFPYLKFHLEDADMALVQTANHYVFVGAEQTSKMAQDVKVGDSLVIGKLNKLSKVVSIEEVKRQGQFHPYTYDGTMFVNGVLTSAHSTDTNAQFVSIFGTKIVGIHAFKQMLFAPLRLLCKADFDKFCSESAYPWGEDSHAWEEIVELFMVVMRGDEFHPDQEEENFLEASISLPFKLAFLLFMVMAQLIDSILNNPLRALAAVVAPFAYFMLNKFSPFGFVLSRSKKIVKTA